MFIVAIFVLGAVVMLLWNALVPVLFHGPEVNYWQAVGLLLLTRILVGIRGRHGHWWWKRKMKSWMWGKRAQHGWGNGKNWNMDSDYCGPWQGGWERWHNMTPEERQQAKEEWKRKKEEWKTSWKSKQE